MYAVGATPPSTAQRTNSTFQHSAECWNVVPVRLFTHIRTSPQGLTDAPRAHTLPDNGFLITFHKLISDGRRRNRNEHQQIQGFKIKEDA